MLILSLSSCITYISAPDGTKLVTTANLGIISNDHSQSQGGLTSAIAGNVSTQHGSTSTEATKPGRISAGGVTLEGPIDHSTSSAVFWHGATSMLRNWVSRLIAGDIFGSIDTKTIESEKTERLKSNNSAAVDTTRIRATESVEKAEIRE